MLCNALTTQNMGQVESLLKNDKIDPNPALHFACIHGNLEIVRLLIGNKRNPANPNKAGVDGKNPFTVAVSHGNTKMVHSLLTESITKVNTNQISRGGSTSPLNTAINKGNVKMVEMLLQVMADPTLKRSQSYQCSPMYVAIEQGKVNICKLLLKYGCVLIADSRRTVHHLSLVEYAAKKGKRQIVQMFLNMGEKVTRPLLEHAISGKDDTMLEYCLEHVYSQVGDEKHPFNECACTLVISSAITEHSIDCLYVLLCWGFYTYQTPARRLEDEHTPFRLAIVNKSARAVMLMARIDPQCLQEHIFVKLSASATNYMKFGELIETRKYPARLDILCRVKILQQLGFSPVHKTEKLPLPRALKNFLKLSGNLNGLRFPPWS